MESIVCNLCGNIYQSNKALKKHFRVKHQESGTVEESIVKCNLCGNTYQSKDALRKHFKTKHQQSGTVEETSQVFVIALTSNSHLFHSDQTRQTEGQLEGSTQASMEKTTEHCELTSFEDQTRQTEGQLEGSTQASMEKTTEHCELKSFEGSYEEVELCEQPSFTQNSELDETEVILRSLQKPNKEDVQAQMEEILKIVSSEADQNGEMCRAAYDQLLRVKTFLSAMGNRPEAPRFPPPSPSRQPANKKAPTQRRLFSVKKSFKKRKADASLSKPSASKKDALLHALSGAGQDHDYL